MLKEPKMNINQVYKLALTIRNNPLLKQKFILNLNEPNFYNKYEKSELISLSSFLIYTRNKAGKSPLELTYLKEIYDKTLEEKIDLHIKMRIKCILYLFFFFKDEKLDSMKSIEAPFTFFQEIKSESTDVYCHSSILSGLIWKKKDDGKFKKIFFFSMNNKKF